MESSDQLKMEHLLKELTELIDMIIHHEGPINLNPSNKILEELKMTGEIIGTINDFLEASQPSLADVDSLIKTQLESPEISNPEKQLLLHSLEVEQEAKILQSSFASSMKKGKKRKSGKSGQSDANRKEMKERRKLFKTIGGDKKWIPM